MSQLIKTFPDGSRLEYDRGNFDDLCVYLTVPGGSRRPPLDTDYFRELLRYADRYGAERVYRSFTRIYDLTGKELSSAVLGRITAIAASYGTDALGMDILLTTLYAAMIAEERKQYTRLGKRVKRLGVHMLLLEGREVEDAANFMRGMPWRRIAEMCRERGF